MNHLVSNNHFKFMKELLQEEQTAVQDYEIAGNGSAYQLNAFLRGQRVAVVPDAVCFERLDSAIHKSRVVEGLQLFRATYAEDFDPFIRDNVFHDPAYASTSLRESNLGGHFVNAFSKNPIKLVISCPPGANAHYLEFSNDNGETESECLLPRGCRYRIDAERPPISETKVMAKEMGQSNWYHAKGFAKLRIYEVSLVVL